MTTYLGPICLRAVKKPGQISRLKQSTYSVPGVFYFFFIIEVLPVYFYELHAVLSLLKQFSEYVLELHHIFDDSLGKDSDLVLKLCYLAVELQVDGGGGHCVYAEQVLDDVRFQVLDLFIHLLHYLSVGRNVTLFLIYPTFTSGDI